MKKTQLLTTIGFLLFIIGFVGDIFSTLLIMGQIELDNRDEPEE